MLLQYRAAAAAGIATQLFWGILRVAIFTAFYHAALPGTVPLSLKETISYVWLTQATLGLLFVRPDADVQEMVRTGTVAYELVRPLDLFAFWYARALAARLAPTLLRITPMLPIALLFFGLQAPAGVWGGTGFLLSILAALFIAAGFGALLSVMLLYTLSGEGVNRLLPSLIWLFSGAILPLALLPPGVRQGLDLLPFRDMLDTPFRIYLGHIQGQGIVVALLRQLVWAFLIALAGRVLLQRAMHRVTAQGG